MVGTILASLVPVFLVMALGYVAGLTRDIDNTDIGALNGLVMDFALPAALFTAMAQTPRSAMMEQADLTLVLVVVMLVVFALGYWAQTLALRQDRGTSALMAMTASGPNVGAAGLPVISAVFSRSASVSVAVAVAVAAIFLTPLTLVLVESARGGKAPIRASILKALMMPVVLAPMLGLAVSLAEVPIPALVNSSLTLVGQGAAGAALFLTGLVLSAQPVVFNGRVMFIVALKNVVQPVLAGILAGSLFGGETARLAVILTAVPSGAFGVLFAVRYRLASAEIGTALIASTLASAATLAGAIAISSVLWG
jgi:malonate transporter and related proteins